MNEDRAEASVHTCVTRIQAASRRAELGRFLDCRKLRTLVAIWLLAAVGWCGGLTGAQGGPELPVRQDGSAQPPVAPSQPVSGFDEGRTVIAIEVEGAHRWTHDQLRAALGQGIGRPLDLDRIREGLERLFRAFHVRASVWKRETAEGLQLRLSVEELPSDLEPRFVGYEAFDLEEIRKWAGLGERQEVYLHEVPRIRERLLEAYRREGHLFAEVETLVRDGGESDAGGESDSEDTGRGDVIFVIREGPEVNVSEIVVHGNESMPDRGALFWKDGLRHSAKTKLSGPSLFDWDGDKFVQEELDADLVAMRQVYRDRGYLDAIVELERLEFSRDRSRVSIHIRVDEGQPYRVSALTIEGVERIADREAPNGRFREVPAPLVFPEEELRDRCDLRPGAIFVQALVQHDERALRDYYGRRGYLSHPSLGELSSWTFLEPQITVDVDRHEVAVSYRILQGHPRRIREVLVSGATHTRDRVIRREITVLPGELADMTKILSSLRRIRASGYFSDPRDPLNHREPTFRFLPTDDPGLVDIEFRVQEGRVVDFQVAGGVSSNSGLFGIISLSMLNFDITDLPSSFTGAFSEIYHKRAFHGAGQRLDIQVSPGTDVDYSRIRFYEPDLLRTHFDRWSLDLEYLDRDRIFSEYDENRTRFKVLIGHQLSPVWSIFGGLSFESLEVSDLDPVVLPTALVDQLGRTQLSSLHLDLRLRDVDRRIDPRDGVEFSWRNQFALDALGGAESFLKSEAGLDWYLPLGPENDVRPGVHLDVGAGLARETGDRDGLLYTERFFLGGFRTMRGFEFRGVGPNVGDTPVGGQTMLRGSLEYRRPLYSVTRPGAYERVEMLRGVLFFDAGILDPGSGSLDLDELRLSAGFGFGLSFPIPLMFNFGFPLRDGEGDGRQTFSFNIAF